MTLREEHMHSSERHDGEDDQGAVQPEESEKPESPSSTLNDTIVRDEYRRQPHFI